MVLCSKKTVGLLVLACTEQVQIKFTDLCRKAVGFILFVFAAIIVLPADTEVIRDTAGGAGPLEYIGTGDTLHPCINTRYRDGPCIRDHAAGNFNQAMMVF